MDIVCAISSNSNAKFNSIAIGDYTVLERKGEFASTATVSATNKAQLTLQKYKEKNFKYRINSKKGYFFF